MEKFHQRKTNYNILCYHYYYADRYIISIVGEFIGTDIVRELSPLPTTSLFKTRFNNARICKTDDFILSKCTLEYIPTKLLFKMKSYSISFFFIFRYVSVCKKRWQTKS